MQLTIFEKRLILLIDIDGFLLKQISFTSSVEPVICLKLVGALIVCTTQKGKIVFWNRRSQKLESVVKCGDDEVPINSISFQNKRFFTASRFY